MTPLKMQVEDLTTLLPQLPERDRTFANSLCQQFIRKGLSAKQAMWVPRLIERARQPEQAPERIAVGSLQPIVTMLEEQIAYLIDDGMTPEEIRTLATGGAL